jgi:hypothetical protein
MGIFIDEVSVYCEANGCDNKATFQLTDGDLENYRCNYDDSIEVLKNEISDKIPNWTTSGKAFGYENNILCQSCTENIDELKADIQELQSKLSSYGGTYETGRI